MEKEPIFSVLIAVFNAEKYLAELFRSIESQSISSDDVEYIFVDDCSEDSSFSIIDGWIKTTTVNARILKNDKNLGVSATRNYGLDEARGRWVTVLDPDDLIDSNYFLEVSKFLNKYFENKISMLITRVAIFDPEYDIPKFNHPLDYRFHKGTRLVSLSEEPDTIQLGATAFIKRERLREYKLCYNDKIKPTFEDADLLSRYLLTFKDPKIGVVKDALYFYRVESKSNSLVRSAWKKWERYTDEFVEGYLPLLETAKRYYGAVPRWLENLMLYQLSWHFTESLNPRGANSWVLNYDDLKNEYFRNIRRVLKFISPRSIIDFRIRNITDRQKIQILAKYYYPNDLIIGKNSSDKAELYCTNLNLSLLEQRLENLKCSSGLELRIQSAYVLGDHFGFELLPPEYVGDSSFSADHVSNFSRELKSLLATEFNIVEIKLEHDFIPGLTRFRKYSGSFESNFAFGGIIRNLIKLNRNFSWTKRLKTAVAISEIVRIKLPHLVRRKLLNVSLGLFSKLERILPLHNPYENSWIFMDRMSGANDNAEHFYRYIAKEHPEKSIFFMLSKKSVDYGRLIDEGFKIVPNNIFRTAQAIAGAKLILVSDWAHKDLTYIWNIKSNFSATPIVFLQHGVTQSDISHWLNGLSLDTVVTSLPQEHDYMTNVMSPFKFKNGECLLVGMPRFDRLRELSKSRKKEILNASGGQIDSVEENMQRLVIMPTWRNSMRDALEKVVSLEGRRKVFSSTTYFKKWNAVLEVLAQSELLAESKIRLTYVAHPNMVDYLGCFRQLNGMEFVDIRKVDFQKLLVDSDFFITDYSSAAFDAALSDSKICYYQFDRDEFFGGEQSMRKGWFSYVEDGYGPVVTDQVAVVDWIKQAVSGLETIELLKYSERISYLQKAVPQESCKSLLEALEERYQGI